MGGVNAAVALLQRNLERHPDKTAYCCDERSITYRQLDGEARRFALLLQRRGLVPGDRALLVLSDTPAFPVAFLGCLLAGVMAVVAGTTLGREDVAHVLRDSGARLLITDAFLTTPVEAAESRGVPILIADSGSFAPDTANDAPLTPFRPVEDGFAYMLYTSGSTGRPKGIPHRHRDLLLPCESVGRSILAITTDDLIFSTSKFSFAYGLVNSLAFPLFFGATAIIHPGKPEPAAILDIIRERRPTLLFSVPTVYLQIVLSWTEPEADLPMRLCYSAGEALSAAIFEEWRRLTGLEIIDGIGSSEMSYVYLSNRPGEVRPGSTGRPVPGYRVRLVDDDGNEVPDGVEGQLLVSGDTMSPWYWNLPEKSAGTMLPDGFMRTGDIFVRRDGFYYHRGRDDDMIKSGGHWVAPAPVEEVLLGHPAVVECAVAAVTVGALVKPGAFVVAAAGTVQSPALERELRKYLLARLPDYMCPVRFTFVRELPRTPTGKIQRFRLRERQ